MKKGKRGGCLVIDEAACCFIDLPMLQFRIAQIEMHIRAHHPRAAKDPVLAALIADIRDGVGEDD